jgi:lysozyme
MKKKKSNRRFFILLFTSLIAIPSAFLLFSPKGQKIIKVKLRGNEYVQSAYRYFSDKVPTGKPVKIPSGYEIHGIDVSRHQGNINWEKALKTKLDNKPVSFAIVKATEGINHTDVKFRQNWSALEKAKISKGAYHFFRPTRSPEEQAKNYISNVRLKKGDLPPLIDVEVTDNVDNKILRERLKKFMQILENHYKVKPIIYTMPGFFNGHLKSDFSKYQYWIAHYKTDKPRFNEKLWKIWQYSDEGRIDGINKNIDLNVFCCGRIEFEKLLIK